MNNKLQDFARDELKEGLAHCTENEQHFFKRLHSPDDLELPIDDVVDSLPDEKLGWAMQQVKRTLAKRIGTMSLPVNYNKLHWIERRAVREAYINIQKGRCCFCGEPLNSKPAKQVRSKRIDKELFPKNFFDWPIHLHHNHKTGMTIGAVHNYCNAVLWQYHGE